MAVEHVSVIETGPHAVHVAAREPQHCGRCALKSGCGHQLLSAGLAGRVRTPTLALPLAPEMLARVRPGDRLELAIDEGRLIRLSLLQYGLPLAFLLGLTAAAEVITVAAGAGESWVIVTALCALIAGFTAVRRVSGNLAMPVTLGEKMTQPMEYPDTRKCK